MLAATMIAHVRNTVGGHGFKDKRLRTIADGHSERNIKTGVPRLPVDPPKLVCYCAHPSLHMFTVRGEREELTGWRDVFSSGLSGQLIGVEWSTECYLYFSVILYLFNFYK